MSGFPEITFGIGACACRGADQSEDLTSADAVARDTTGNGAKLVLYNGKYMCQICIDRIKADEESYEDARKQAEAEKFRGKAGFVNTVS